MTIHYNKNGQPACGAKLRKHDRISVDVCMPTCPMCGDIIRIETGTPAMVRQYVECPPHNKLLGLF